MKQYFFFAVILLVAVDMNAQSKNGHEYVDLGLSVKWATCNIGANTPYAIGDFFAWGETSTKANYDWETNKHVEADRNGKLTKVKKYKISSGMMDRLFGSPDNKKTLNVSDDAAAVNWGGGWRMPTKDEFDELINFCNWTVVTHNGKNYFKGVSVRNGNSIIFSGGGDREGTGGNLTSMNIGLYWTSSLCTDPDQKSMCGMCFCIFESKHEISSWPRRNGLLVRPVIK